MRTRKVGYTYTEKLPSGHAVAKAVNHMLLIAVTVVQSLASLCQVSSYGAVIYTMSLGSVTFGFCSPDNSNFIKCSILHGWFNGIFTS
jgi:hypothetical protein